MTTRLATVYLRPLLGVVALAALMTVGNAFRFEEDCARPDALRDASALPGAAEGTEQEGRYDDSVFQRTEGRIAGTRLHFSVVRARVPGDLSHSPTRFARSRITPERDELAWIEADGVRLPVHCARLERAGSVELACYVFVYLGRPVADPLPDQLATAGSQLLHGSRPATLLLVWGTVRAPYAERARENAEQWLVDAWRHYDRACTP